ncbi:MAG: thioredoxin domain-containing protein [Holosporales bacterium]|jgi:protein-disulfide isomerase|nr:thioredoxin domain-containing protein [Holosporales bacterium]
MENKGSASCKLGIVISILALIVASAAYFCPRNTCFGTRKTSELTVSSTFDEKVKSIVVDLVKQNPQLLMDAMGEGIAKKREDAMKQLHADVLAQKDELEKQSLKFGKSDSKTSVICFFDPLCKHCIEFQKTMSKLIKAKKDVRFNLLPVAVLGEDSIVLAKTYFAVYEKSPDKAATFIDKITEDGSAMDKPAIEKALKSAGLESKEIEGMLEAADKKLAASGAMAEKLRVPVVPAIFIINGSNVNMIQGTGIDDILPLIEQVPAQATKAEESSEKSK